MRRNIEWKTRRDDGTSYEVRVSNFGGKYKFQFLETGTTAWDYKRPPSIEDLEKFCEAVRRRHPRQQVSNEELARAERMLADAQRTAVEDAR